jgi:nitrite reductase (NO-forming)
MEAVSNQARKSNAESESAAWLIVAAAALRTAFGILMAIDAWLKWSPGFAAHYVGYLHNAANAQPPWLQSWFQMWLRLVTMHTEFFITATRLIETAIAIGLLLGLARRVTYFAGALFSLLIWSTAEGFGGPYTSGATNVGPALVYALVFIAAALFEHLLGRNPYSVDYYIGRRFPKWANLVEWAPTRSAQPPPALNWDQQLGVIGGILVILVFALATLGSARTVLPPTPQNAAAAVSPLRIASGSPVAHPFSPVLPPLIGNGDAVDVTIESKDVTIEIASGVQYRAWTFNGTVPGPILHVRQGQTVNITFVNNGMMQHSIDFHAAQVAPNIAYRSINPGEKLEFSFVAGSPGEFV